jgi:hypothetical protein
MKHGPQEEQLILRVRTMKRAAGVVLFSICLAVNQSTQGQTPTPPPINTGPEVGHKIPTFGLQDQNGRLQDLSSIMGPKGAAIYFNRSADW